MEGDIKACFDEISHTGLMDRLSRRIGDKLVLRLVKAFPSEDVSRGTRSLARPKEGYAKLVISLLDAVNRGPAT